MEKKSIAILVGVLLIAMLFVDGSMTGFVIKKKITVASCNDPDGKDFFTKGTATAVKSSGSQLVKTDKCTLTGKLDEWECNAQGTKLLLDRRNCAKLQNGSSCEDGACVNMNYCGDAVCDEDESCSSCAADCGQCPCTETCASKGYQCGNQLICSETIWCGNCSAGYSCVEGVCVASGCSELDQDVLEDIESLQNQGYKVVLNEGEKFGSHYNEQYVYVVVPSDEVSILRILNIKNSSSPSYSSDVLSFVDYPSGEKIYDSVFNSEGVGTVVVGGIIYNIYFSGASTAAREDYLVWLDFPQTSGEDKMSFEDCPCTETCASKGYQCGNQLMCNNSISCGTCNAGYNCASGVCVVNGCSDTDGGLNYGIKGTVNVSNQGYFSDNCISNFTLKEYYCSGSRESTTNYTCSGNYTYCYNGRCW